MSIFLVTWSIDICFVIGDTDNSSLKINSTKIIDSSFTIIDAIQKLNLIESRSEIKRLIKSNGIKINNLIYKENDFSLTKYINEKEIKISVGKKKIGILKITK